MSDCVPTIDEVRDSLVYLNKYHAKQYGDVDLLVVGSETAAQFDRMIAEVERAAAARALEAEAENLFRIIGNQRAIFQEPAATQMNRGIHLSAERLRARAAEIREERR